MMSRSDSKYLAYLTALSIFFSYMEAIFPHFLPFLRIGLSNIVVLSSFSLNFLQFLALIILKSLISSLLSGTLFSPFVLISISQSFVSGLLMYVLFYLNKKIFREKLLSLYGISLLGSSASGAVQMVVASLYLGRGVYSLLGLMLLFSLFSGLLTAFLRDFFDIAKTAPKLEILNDKKEITKKEKIDGIVNVLLVIICIIISMAIKNLILLSILTLLSFIMQIVAGRKLKILVHLFMWLFICSL